MTTSDSLRQSTIAAHPDFPFIRIGLAFDFDPDLADLNPLDHVVERGDWWMEVAGTVHGCAYNSREDALEDVDSVLFDTWRDGALVQQQIEAAVNAGNVSLALRLAEGRGRATGRLEVERQIAAALAMADSVLKPFKRDYG